MSRPINTSGNRRLFSPIILSASVVVSCALMPFVLSRASDSPDVTTLTYTVQVTQTSTPTSDPTCPVKQDVEGAGLTNLLGTVHDQQSHCVHPDGTIDQGVFTMTGSTVEGELPGGDDSGDSISGQYRAHLVPTISSQLTNPPGGFWLIYGEVCTLKGTGKFAGVINDCPTATSPGRFVPARLTIDFTDNETIAFGTMVLRFRDHGLNP